jgi:hypothetical protein
MIFPDRFIIYWREMFHRFDKTSGSSGSLSATEWTTKSHSRVMGHIATKRYSTKLGGPPYTVYTV